MKKFKSFIISLIALTTFGLAACGGGGSQPSGDSSSEPANTSSEPSVNVDAIVLDTYELSLLPEEEAVITASVEPAGTVCEIVWSSSDPTVASVTNGRVKALAQGTTNIVASVKGTNVSDHCVVTVAAPFHDYVTDGSVKLSLDYTGKDFFKDGVQAVGGVIRQDAICKGDLCKEDAGIRVYRITGIVPRTYSPHHHAFTAVDVRANPVAALVGIHRQFVTGGQGD